MKAVFSQIQSALLRELDNAKVSIEIAVAWFTNAVLMECLLAKLSKGVSVTLILNNDEINNNESNNRFLEHLIVGGCKIHWINYPELMHQKFCIIDSKVVINGSYNWTYYAENHHRENVVILDDAFIADSFHREFLNMLSVYPSCEEIPTVGGSSFNPSDTKRYRDSDKRFSANYYNDVPEYSLSTEWTQKSIINAIIKHSQEGRALIKWAQDDSEKNMFSKETNGFYISEYNEDEEFGHSNKPGRQFFKVFACSDSTEILVLDGDKCVFKNTQNITTSSEMPVLLYSSFKINSVYNSHLAYRYNPYCIPVKISIISEKANALNFSIETMLGIKEMIEHDLTKGTLNIRYKSVPDGRFYYMVLRPSENTEGEINVVGGSQSRNYKFTVKKGIVYYIGYICNVSSRYGTRKLFIQKGINK